MQIISVSNRKMSDPAAFTPELAARESARVRELYASGILRQIWRKTDPPGAVMLWEAASVDEVSAALESLPLRQAGLLEFVVLSPLEAYPGFVSL